jgi:beta-lactamase class A
MRRAIIAASIILLVAFGVGRVGAETSLTPQAALERLLSSDHVDASWFAQSFLDQVSTTQLDSIMGQLKAELGAFQSVKPEGMKYRVIFARGDDMASIALDASGRITGLFFEPPNVKASSFQGALDAFKDLPGHVSITVLENGAQRAVMSPDQVLAVGSTFKLAVLSALNKEVEARTTSWESVVKLQAGDKSLPSGKLQEWPNGAPLTVYSLAALMISQSDNTATDTLIAYVGRRNVEAFTTRNRPFLTTREAFVLKDPKNADVLKRYRDGNEAERRALLTQVDTLPLPDVSILSGGPQATDVEWFFTTRELCGLMRNVEALPLMGINPGVARPADWQRISYKGGSEPSVMNLTTWLVAKDRKSYCVSVTWNDDKPLDELKFSGLYGSLLSALKL